MNDSYAEWLVKRKNPAYNIVLKAALVLLCAISLVLALVTPLGIIILTVVGIASYFAFQSLSQEFEYLVVNDQITIDRVLGKARRKKGWEGSLADVQIIGPVDAYQVKDQDKQGIKVLDFSSHQPGAKVYAIIYQKGGNWEKILFEPNHKILDCLRQRSPRKVIL